MPDIDLSKLTGTPVVMPIVTPPVAFTPVLTNGPTLDLGSTGMYWYRVGNLMHIGGRILSSGAGAAGPLAMDVPMGLTVGPMVGLSGTNFNKGKFTRTGTSAGNAVKQGTFAAAGGFKILPFCYDDYTTASAANGAQNGSTIFPGANWGVHINSEIVIPILEWGENTHQAYGAGLATANTPGLVKSRVPTTPVSLDISGGLSGTLSCNYSMTDGLVTLRTGTTASQTAGTGPAIISLANIPTNLWPNENVSSAMLVIKSNALDYHLVTINTSGTLGVYANLGGVPWASEANSRINVSQYIQWKCY